MLWRGDSEMGREGEKKGVHNLDSSVLFKFFIGWYSCISYAIKHMYKSLSSVVNFIVPF